MYDLHSNISSELERGTIGIRTFTWLALPQINANSALVTDNHLQLFHFGAFYDVNHLAGEHIAGFTVMY